MMAADDICKGSGGCHRCRGLGDYCIERAQRCGHDAGVRLAYWLPNVTVVQAGPRLQRVRRLQKMRRDGGYGGSELVVRHRMP